MPKRIICWPVCEPAGAAANGRAARLSRRAFGRAALVGLSAALLGGCDSGAPWHSIDVSHSSPALGFTMTRARDGREVGAGDYRRRIVLLYFGYTFCPDACPTTLLNITRVLDRLGAAAGRVRALFVTVDPHRDTLPVLAAYVRNFAPQIDGLRGTPDQLTALARRYRVVYSVTPASEDHPYEVTHSSAIYVFDGTGAARLLIPSLSSTTPDIAGVAADLRRLLDEKPAGGLIGRLERLV